MPNNILQAETYTVRSFPGYKMLAFQIDKNVQKINQCRQNMLIFITKKS